MVSHVGGIYLKNMIAQYWKDREATELIDGVAPFVIAEQDKATIREHIVEAVIHAPELIRYRLNILGCRAEVVRPVLTCNTSISTCIKKAYVLVRMVRHGKASPHLQYKHKHMHKKSLCASKDGAT